MKIISWNVAGLRAMIKERKFTTIASSSNDFDIVCLQETKAEEQQVTLCPLKLHRQVSI